MTSKNRNASSYLQTAAVAQQESFDPSTDGDASVRGLPLTTSVSVLALLCRDMVSLQNQTLTADQRRLRMAASHCRWLSYNLGRRGRRNFAERRRKLVLRAVHISRQFIMSGEPGVAIDELNFILKILPNAVLIHAGLVCALLAARRPEAQETLCCYINQQICRVRWHNLVFYQLHQVRSLSGVSRIVSELEALLDCMQPSAAELERIRQRLPDLAGADFDARTVARHGPTASAEAKPEAAGALDTGGASTPHTAAPLCNSINPAPSSGQEDDVSLRLARLKFDLPDFMIFGIEPTLPNNPIEIRLRKAALNWRRRTYAGTSFPGSNLQKGVRVAKRYAHSLVRPDRPKADPPSQYRCRHLAARCGAQLLSGFRAAGSGSGMCRAHRKSPIGTRNSPSLPKPGRANTPLGGHRVRPASSTAKSTRHAR